MYSDADVTLLEPSDEEAAAPPAPAHSLTEAALAAGSDAGGGGAPAPWLGCVVAADAVAGGDVVGRVAGVEGAEACCRECRARGSACNGWNYCGAGEGQGCCFSDFSVDVDLDPGECEHQLLRTFLVPSLLRCWGWLTPAARGCRATMREPPPPPARLPARPAPAADACPAPCRPLSLHRRAAVPVAGGPVPGGAAVPAGARRRRGVLHRRLPAGCLGPRAARLPSLPRRRAVRPAGLRVQRNAQVRGWQRGWGWAGWRSG
jgi:hypothetical protein